MHAKHFLNAGGNIECKETGINIDKSVNVKLLFIYLQEIINTICSILDFKISRPDLSLVSRAELFTFSS